VAAALRPYVAGVSVGGHEDRRTLIHLPDPSAQLVWRMTADGRGGVFAIGPRTHASYYQGKDLPLVVKFRFRPGRARSLLGVEASAIVDRVVPLGDLWGESGDRLADELGLDPVLGVERIEKALLARVSDDRSASMGVVRHAVVSLSADAGRSPVRDTAQRLGISERHLRNVFSRAVGVSPKHFARISRVRAVIAGARGVSWARLADEAGYYDQSPMTAEFREIMHVSPGVFTAGRLPAVPC
jgi:AraC-like DNA-binding protein